MNPADAFDIQSLIHEWQTIGSGPISPVSATGQTVHDDPAFLELRAEIKKMEALSGGQVDWARVVDLGRTILESRSKDLQSASYLVVGLFRQRGYEGLLAGLSCFESLVTTYWGSLYPQEAAGRTRARRVGSEWLAEKLNAEVQSRKPKGGREIDCLHACIESSNSLEGFFQKTIGDGVKFGSLARRMAELAPPITKEALPAAPMTRPESPPVAPSRDVPRTAVAPTAKTVARLWEELRNAAELALAENPKLAWTYRVIRLAAWFDFDGYPEAEGQKTRIPGPPAGTINRFETLKKNQPLDLLQEAEAAIASYPCWLELQWFSFTALTSLGEEYGSAREALLVECALLGRRLPNLVNYQFSNGTPFASPEVAAWFAQVVETAERSDSPSPAYDPGSAASRASIQIESVEVLQEALSACRSNRERFLLRLQFAQRCLQGKERRLSLAMFAVLNEDIERYSLEEWEPELCVEVLMQWWKAIRGVETNTNSGLADLQNRIYNRVVKLDISSARKLKQRER